MLPLEPSDKMLMCFIRIKQAFVYCNNLPLQTLCSVIQLQLLFYVFKVILYHIIVFRVGKHTMF